MAAKVDSRQYWEELGSSGKTYQMGNQPQRVEIFDLLEHHDCASVLDVGCGTGSLYGVLKEFGTECRYKGVDYSSTFIDTCKREFPEVKWEQQDARNLTEQDNSFDAVVFLHCLDHVDFWESALKHAKRIARKIVIVCLWRPFLGTPTKTNPDGLMTEFNKNELDAVLVDMGFEIIEDYQLDSEKYNYFYVLGVE